ncbi:unnamed protein product [Adineta steineri]|uniref:CMP-sialic acid transporter n=1 Tax=Adineta steineri TaxID=433720 RepID=A0A818S350_9BILA|nr:unnamed protein product [Adineta steineri]
MGLFINQGLLITGSKTSTHSYKYNTISVVLLTELVKLIAAIIIYRQTHSWSQMRKEITENRTVFFLYLAPAALYCLYNNLAFLNLSSYDPTTYFLLLQFRVVVTAVIFQVIISIRYYKRLTCIQWLSLFILTFGCIIKQFEHSSTSTILVSKNTTETEPLITIGRTIVLPSFTDIHFIWMLVQVFCSCFAGVYTEYLLKNDRSIQVDIMLQNTFMYTNSIVCNIVLLILFEEQQPSMTTTNNFFNTLKSIISGQQLLVPLIILNNAAIGLVTSLFLKSMNSILKTFASALELFFTSILAWLIFSIPISGSTCLAIIIVSTAVYLYSTNPVVNLPKTNVEEEPTVIETITTSKN